MLKISYRPSWLWGTFLAFTGNGDLIQVHGFRYFELTLTDVDIIVLTFTGVVDLVEHLAGCEGRAEFIHCGRGDVGR